MPSVQTRGVRSAPLPLPLWSILPLSAVWHVPGSTFETARQDRPEAWRVPEPAGAPDRQRPPVSLPVVPAAIFRPARAGGGERRRIAPFLHVARRRNHRRTAHRAGPATRGGGGDSADRALRRRGPRSEERRVGK